MPRQYPCTLQLQPCDFNQESNSICKLPPTCHGLPMTLHHLFLIIQKTTEYLNFSTCTNCNPFVQTFHSSPSSPLNIITFFLATLVFRSLHYTSSPTLLSPIFITEFIYTYWNRRRHETALPQTSIVPETLILNTYCSSIQGRSMK